MATTDIKALTQAATQGDADAQNGLGFALDHGRGIAQDHAEAVKWFRKAADQGHVSAQVNLGYAYHHGRGIEQDHAESAKWYRKAAAQGNAEAQFNLGFAYFHGNGVTQDKAEGVKWYHLAAEQGDFQAQDMLGDCYAEGQGIKQDHGKAVEWWTKSAAQGNHHSMCSLGNAHLTGEGFRQDFDKAMDMWTVATVFGNDAAEQFVKTAAERFHKLGFEHEKAKPKRRDAAVEAWIKAHELGHVAPEGNLPAIEAIQKAAEQGSQRAKDYLEKQEKADASHKLGFEHEKAKPKDRDSAVEAWIKAHELGHVAPEGNLPAIKAIQEAAKQGSQHAKNYLGKYVQGLIGIPVDPQKILPSVPEQPVGSEEAAMKGDAEAMLSLAEGKNDDKALDWYARAAVHGDENQKKRAVDALERSAQQGNDDDKEKAKRLLEAALIDKPPSENPQ